MDNKEGMPVDMRVGFMHHNLNQITRFHNHIYGFFNGNLAESQADEEISQGDKSWLKQEYTVHMPNQLRKSVFLMMFGHLEEHLYLSWCDNGGNQEEKNDSEDGVKKYKKLFRNIDIDILRDQDYQLIVDAYKIRNSIIHSAGRIDIIKRPEDLEAVIKKHSDYFSINNKRINITNEGIFHFRRAIEAFSERVARAAKG